MKKSKRGLFVFTGLVAVLTGTSAFLLAVAPRPLDPEPGPQSLSASFRVEPDPLPSVFETRVPLQPGRWAYIYLHHTRSSASTALPGDHFLVTANGELQMTLRWDHQSSATPPAGARDIHPRCISVALAGDFDSAVPTPIQMRRTEQLVQSLQRKLKIPSTSVLTVTQDTSPAAMGKYFPLVAFRQTLIR